MSLQDLIETNVSDDYYNPKFRTLLEAYMPTMRNLNGTIRRYVDPSESFLYRNDFVAYLNSLNVPAHLHWIIMRLNSMTSFQQFDKSYTSILIPNPDDVQRILIMWNTASEVTA